MRKVSVLLALVGLFAAPTVSKSCPSPSSYALGYSTWGKTTSGTYYPGYGYVPYYQLKKAKYVIREVLDDGSLRIWDEGDGQEHIAALSDEVILRARYKKDFEGRRKLVHSDLRPGQRVAVTALKKSGTVLRMKVIGHREGVPRHPMLAQLQTDGDRTVALRSGLGEP